MSCVPRGDWNTGASFNASARHLAGPEKYTIGHALRSRNDVDTVKPLPGAVRASPAPVRRAGPVWLRGARRSARQLREWVSAVIVVAVRVHPGASREGVALLPDGTLDVRLRARAIEGQANAGLVALLADRLGVRRRDVEIASGVRSRQKVVRIELPSAEELRRRLGEAT